jgi:stalled ribosome rescue protein Dom34
MISKSNGKFFVVLEDFFELFLLSKILRKGQRLYFKKKIEVHSRVRKEEKKEDKEDIWLNLKIEEGDLKDEALIIKGNVENHWIKSKEWNFNLGDSFQIEASSTLLKNPLLCKILSKKECPFFYVSFFHEVLTIYRIENDKIRKWRQKEFQWQGYYIDIRNYLVPYLKEIEELGNPKVIIFTSGIINEELKIHLLDYDRYTIIIGNEEDPLYQVIKRNKVKENLIILKTAEVLSEMDRVLYDSTLFSEEPEGLYDYKRPSRVIINPSLFKEQLEQFYQIILILFSLLELKSLLNISVICQKEFL